MSELSEARHAAGFVLSEAQGKRSRANLLIAASMTVLAGTVLGVIAAGSGVTVDTPAFTGTGNGAITLANPAYGAGVQAGTYVVRLIEAGSDSGQFQVIRPDGTVDGLATVAAAYDGQVKFTIADGATDFSAAAQFTIDVTIDAADVGQYAVFDQDGTDGSEIAAAIALYPVTTGSGETARIAGIVRDAEVNGNLLQWPDDIEAEEKAAAIAQLAKAGIIVR